MDGVAYTQSQFADFWRSLLLNSITTEGVLPTYNGELAVSGTSSPISMAVGAAIVYGYWYLNDTLKSIAVSTPAIGTTGKRVVLRVDWAAQTVRVVLLTSSDGVATIPSLTQTAGTTYEIPLASLTITTGGVIAVTDQRSYCHFATRVNATMLDTDAVTATKILNGTITTAKMADDSIDQTKIGTNVLSESGRQGGSATDWTSPGTTSRTVGNVRMQCGAVTQPNASDLSVTFPVAFSQKPIVFAWYQGNPTTATVYVDPAGTTAAGFTVVRVTGSVSALVHWIAFGQE